MKISSLVLMMFQFSLSASAQQIATNVLFEVVPSQLCRSEGLQCELRYSGIALQPIFGNGQIGRMQAGKTVSFQVGKYALAVKALNDDRLFSYRRPESLGYVVAIRFDGESNFREILLPGNQNVIQLHIPASANRFETYFYVVMDGKRHYISNYGRNFHLPVYR